MPRGPTPKPAGICPSCNRFTSSWTRGYCKSCYVRCLRSGTIQKLDRPKERLTALQEELLEGLMLGDGCLYRRKTTHLPYLSVQRKLEDIVYLNWQAQQFKAHMKRLPYTGETYDQRTRKTYGWCRFVTRRSKAFVEPYGRWYLEGNKEVPDDVKLTPLSLAIWFADDGWCGSSCSPWRIKMKISTHGFKPHGVERLADLLTQRYHSHFGVGRDGKHFFIHTADVGARALALEIDPMMLQLGMERKCSWREPAVRFYENPPNPQPGWAKTRPK